MSTSTPPRTATRLVTSPLFFAHEQREGTVCALGLSQRARLRALGLRAWELLHFYLEPRTRQDAETAGYTAEEENEAVQAGLLVDVDTAEDMFRWERHRWSRAAYLLYSQQDLPYVEPVGEGRKLSSLSAFRREQISGFQDGEPYPERFRIDPVRTHRLPVPDEPITYSLDSMLARRSTRRFSREPVSQETLGALLHHATAHVRLAEGSKAAGDPYYLLNSFYTWLHLYVVVQGVEGVPNGVYQYDFFDNALLATGREPSVEKVASTIQGQNWIGGGGVSLFITVQWDRYQWLYRHSRAYLNLLIQLGEFAQELLQAGYQLGLTGWLTPAVSESRAAELLGLDAVGCEADAMYYMKLGYDR
ncbi:SagB/ThcOx family dehydrogenase [Streptomyces fulvoviolaceus]|uniref:SagB/ThcOx family dehydrogenase n=1 Tax=Streptomyces fulvoviolaceus TaxID=285535 RepID=UPI0021BE32C7|nr:SagB/ThcOx family dehydrogenase [Streptomyces fulvoviolaceus]MCT9076527.1 SagB/ThcOx family dehydrogenase [Streptomyces fulvoviolaceus]